MYFANVSRAVETAAFLGGVASAASRACRFAAASCGSSSCGAGVEASSIEAARARNFLTCALASETRLTETPVDAKATLGDSGYTSSRWRDGLPSAGRQHRPDARKRDRCWYQCECRTRKPDQKTALRVDR